MAAKKEESKAEKPMTTDSFPKGAQVAVNPVTGVESPVYRLDQGNSLPPQNLNLNPDRAK